MMRLVCQVAHKDWRPAHSTVLMMDAQAESFMTFTIAIDGPAAAGKGTLSRKIAETYGFHHLDTGLTYRATAKALLDAACRSMMRTSLKRWRCNSTLPASTARCFQGTISARRRPGLR